MMPITKGTQSAPGPSMMEGFKELIPRITWNKIDEAAVYRARERIRGAFPITERRRIFGHNEGKDRGLEELVEFIAGQYEHVLDLNRIRDRAEAKASSGPYEALFRDADASERSRKEEVSQLLRHQGRRPDERNQIMREFEETQMVSKALRRSVREQCESQVRELQQAIQRGDDYVRELQDQIQQAQAENQSLHAKNQANQEQYQRHTDKLVQDHKELTARERHEHAGQIKHMQDMHAREVQMLKGNLNSLSGIVFKRDNFTAIPDQVLGEKFEALASDVEQLSIKNWRLDQPLFADHVLRRITPNPDLMRRDILQDSIWWLLMDHVFCSPFRMFGKQGLNLEHQWTETFGVGNAIDDGDYVWPSASLKAEEFRYDTVKSCHTALVEPASELDPRARVKVGYKETKDALKFALADVIEEVAETDEDVDIAIEKLVKRAHTLWLEFGVQKCRLMLRMPGRRLQAEEKLREALGRGLVLTSVPELIRFGNSKGHELEVNERVAGCAEKVRRYPLRQG